MGASGALRLALLSTARINEAVVAGARALDGIEVVAIGSRDLGRAEAQAAALGVPRALASYAAVVEDPGVDAVYVPLPNSLHVDWSVRALEAGKHVLCEKPFTRRPEEAERAFDAAEAARRVLAEAFMWRHHPQARRLRELLPRIGELRLVRGAFSFPLARAGDVRLDPELDGGALMDVGCYCVSAARLLAGEPVAVAAHAVGEGVDTRLTASMRFPDGVLALFDCAMDLPSRDELEVVGSDGLLYMDDPWHSHAPVIELHGSDGTVEAIEIEEADPYACQLADFAAACAGTAAHPFGRDDAVGQARALALLHASAEKS